jgi:hypothetical protein
MANPNTIRPVPRFPIRLPLRKDVAKTAKSRSQP